MKHGRNPAEDLSLQWTEQGFTFTCFYLKVLPGSIPYVTIPPPPGISAGIWLFFLFCVLFLVPRHEKGDNSPPPGLLSTSTMSVCAIKSWQYWLLYNSKNRLTRRSRSLLRYWNVTKYLTWFHLLCIQVFRSKPISRMRGFPTVNVNLFNFIIYNRQPWILLLTKILNRRDEGFGL